LAHGSFPHLRASKLTAAQPHRPVAEFNHLRFVNLTALAEFFIGDERVWNVFADLPSCPAIVTEDGEVVPLPVRPFVERNNVPAFVRPARELDTDAWPARNSRRARGALRRARYVQWLGPRRAVVIG